MGLGPAAGRETTGAMGSRRDSGRWPERRFRRFFDRLSESGAALWVEPLRELTCARLRPDCHGDLAGWQSALARLPGLPATQVSLDRACISVQADRAPTLAEAAQLRHALDALHPWRKGPFCLHGLHLDAEWRSDLKWARLAQVISPLAGRLVLDVGCGNGYYGYRALGGGARLVLGIDPTLRFVLQFLALNQLIGEDRLAVLPLADDDLPDLPGWNRARGAGFDTLFSMGVLYHRRDPAVHLARLHHCLRAGGELVLETLVIDGDQEDQLSPRKRYARMRNVHAIPTIPRLRSWLSGAGFADIQVVDISRTSTAEQRSTAWMRFQSLADFLDPCDPDLTIEGYPAPRRAILTAIRPPST